MALQPGESIRLATADSVENRVFVAADYRSLTVLNLDGLAKDEAVKARLIDVIKKHAATIGQGQPYATESVRVATDGVCVHSVKVGELDQTVERHAAGDVHEVTRSTSRGSAGAAVGGAVGGLLLGIALAVGLAYAGECETCSGVTFGIALSLVGAPAAIGYGAWRASIKTVEETVYTR